METLILIVFCMFVLYALLQFIAWIGRALFGVGSPPPPPENPWDNVNAVVAMPVQRPDGSLEQAKIVWESIPAPGSTAQPRGPGRRP